MADPDEIERHLAEVEREIHDAVSQIMGRHGLMVTKWLCVAELLGADGQRMLESFASPDMRAWDTIGMIGLIEARERGVLGAAAAADRFGEE